MTAKGPGQVRVNTTPAPSPQGHIPKPPPNGVADELARVRAQLEAAHRELGRLRRHTRHGACACRDDAAQAWADNDVLHDRLRRYMEMHDAQVQTIRELRAALTAATTPAIPQPDTTRQPLPQPVWAWPFTRRTR